MSKMRIMCYQPPRHNCFQPGAVFKQVTAVEHFGKDVPDIVAITVSSLVKKLYTRKPISLATVLNKLEL
jgi:hypothetical protein